jgi:LCP family protein required for cell wall assembly
MARALRWPGHLWSRVVLIIAVTLAVLAVAVVIDVGLLSSRLRHVTVNFPESQEGTTWVVVGSDSRAALPPGRNFYGTAEQTPGAHADAVIIVHEDRTGTAILSVPRDILVSPKRGEISRLTLTLDEGPQQLVDGLCRSLQIPASHLVIITMKGFAAAVDALGGVTITNPTPVRDFYSELDLTKVGRVRLNGAQVLALVRSRHPQKLSPFGWLAAQPAEGDAARTRSLGSVFSALAAKAHKQRTNPIALQNTAWGLTQNLTTDRGTSLLDLLHLNLTGAHVVDVPVQYLGRDGTAATPDAATYKTLNAAGYSQPCQ